MAGMAEAGGGFVNFDFYARAVTAARQVWTVLGEGTFHQVHDGAATGLATNELDAALTRWTKESEEIRGPLPKLDPTKFVLAGHMPPELTRWLCRNSQETSRQHAATLSASLTAEKVVHQCFLLLQLID